MFTLRPRLPQVPWLHLVFSRKRLCTLTSPQSSINLCLTSLETGNGGGGVVRRVTHTYLGAGDPQAHVRFIYENHIFWNLSYNATHSKKVRESWGMKKKNGKPTGDLLCSSESSLSFRWKSTSPKKILIEMKPTISQGCRLLQCMS